MRRLRILTWQTHGNYLDYLSHCPHDFYVLSRPGRPQGYAGCCQGRRWRENVLDQPLATLRGRTFDCVLYQDDAHYLHDRYRWLDARQRALPGIYLEHDPPRGDPTDTRHPVDDARVLLVHVTPFNALMWDNGKTPVRVIEHGVPEPAVRWHGERAQGITVVNQLARRGRRLGADLFLQAREQVPLELIGMDSPFLGGAGEVPSTDMAAWCARYRFFFHPVRYTSLGLGVIEAMMLGMPIVSLATTEMPSVIRHGENGFISNDLPTLIAHMRDLLHDHSLAARLGERARRDARERFAIERFVADWNAAFRWVTA